MIKKNVYRKFILLSFSIITFSFTVFGQVSNILKGLYDVSFYHLNLHLSDTTTFISGSTKIGINIASDFDTLILDLGANLNVDSVLIENIKVNFLHRNELLEVIDNSFKEKTFRKVEVFYSGDGNSPHYYGAIFNREQAPFGRFTYSLTEPFSTKCWFPCKEVLSDKADSVFIYLTVEKNLKAGSNGLLKDVVDVDEKHIQYQWESRYPTAFYLISVAVGNYKEYSYNIFLEQDSVNIPFVNYIYNSEDYLNNQKEHIDSTRHLLNLFSQLFDSYPFKNEKYGHCIVPLGGGMEHQTMTTLGNFQFDLVSHELAHQWFGNSVTCSSWNDIWINEGFASYSEYLAREFSGDLDGAKVWMDFAHQTAINSPTGSIYVPDDELSNPSRIFDYSTTYKKGAAILHMIRYELGNDNLFFDILRTFLAEHKFGVAGAMDFQLILEEFTGRSFELFFEQWYYGAGYPIFDFAWYQQNDSLYIQYSQKGSERSVTDVFDVKMDFRIIYDQGEEIVQGRCSKKSSELVFPVNFPVMNVRIDPEGYILKEINSVSKVDSFDIDSTPELIVFPNPVKGSFKILSRKYSAPLTLSFYNLAGVRIKTVENVRPNGKDIAVDDLTKGVYLVAIELDSSMQVVKLIKS
jgi:aminopeptidase N